MIKLNLCLEPKNCEKLPQSKIIRVRFHSPLEILTNRFDPLPNIYDLLFGIFSFSPANFHYVFIPSYEYLTDQTGIFKFLPIVFNKERYAFIPSYHSEPHN